MPAMPQSPASAPDCLPHFPPQPAQRPDTAASWPRRMSRALRSLAVLSVLAAPALMAIGCGSESPPKDNIADFAPPPAGEGVQFRMLTTLDPGQEIERCQFFVAPPEGLNINHDLVKYTPGSHHVLLYMTPYKQIPTQDIHKKTRDTSTIMDCPEGATGDWEISNVLAGAQTFDGGSMVNFPPDTAVKVPGGTVLLMNAHYLNASAKSLTAEVRLNVYTIPTSAMKNEGGLLFYYNPFIHVPAMSKASARMSCKVTTDITLTNVQSHMHKRGMNYQADLRDEKGGMLQTLYTNTEWENVPVKSFEPGLAIKKGSQLDYRCDYKNHEDHDISQGPSTKDEMCMLIGSYYPHTPETGFCFQRTFIGTGTNTCGQAYSCALLAGASSDQGAFFGCIVESCPAVAPQLTEAISCFFSRGGNACRDACKTPTDAKCQECVTQSCQPAISACQAAPC